MPGPQDKNRVELTRYDYTGRSFEPREEGAWVHFADVARLLEEREDKIMSLADRVQYLERQVNQLSSQNMNLRISERNRRGQI